MDMLETGSCALYGGVITFKMDKGENALSVNLLGAMDKSDWNKYLIWSYFCCYRLHRVKLDIVLASEYMQQLQSFFS